jgi:ATP-dependent DNA helicase RecG
MKAGHPEPFYTQESGGIKLKLPSNQIIGGGVTTLTTQGELTKQQYEILDILKQYDELSTAEIRSLINNPPSERWVRGQLLRLKELGYVTYIGKTKSRKWSLLR